MYSVAVSSASAAMLFAYFHSTNDGSRFQELRTRNATRFSNTATTNAAKNAAPSRSLYAVITPHIVRTMIPILAASATIMVRNVVSTEGELLTLITMAYAM